jgi:Flp pilus assembly protein TadG
VYLPLRGASGRRGRRHGGASAELALLTPVLLFVLMIAIDFCRLFYSYNVITNAARNGALWLSDPLAPTQSPYTTFQNAALADANNLSPALTTSNVTSTTGTDGQGNATAIVTVSYTFPLITSYLGMSNASLSRQITMRVEPLTPN